MRFFLTTLGTRGDVVPFICMAKKLEEMNHEAIILSNGEFKDFVESEGVKFHSVSEKEELENALDYLVNNAMMWEKKHEKKNPLQQVVDNNSDIFLKPAAEIDRYITENYVEGDTFIIEHVLCFGSRYVQDKLNIPGLSITLTPFYVRSKVKPPKQVMIPAFLPDSMHYKFEKWFNDTVLYKKMFEQFKNFDMTPYVDGDKRISPQGLICFTPEFLTQMPSDWSKNSVSAGIPYLKSDNQELDPQLVDFMKGDKAPMIFSLGAKQRIDMTTFKKCIQMCDIMKRRGVFIGLDRKKIEGIDIPDYVKIVDFAPIDALLQYASVLVYHGGIGTCAAALRNGVPHVILPEFPEHFDTARRLEELELGFCVNRNKFNPAKVAKKIETLFHSSDVQRSCKTYQNKVSVDNPMEIFYKEVERVIAGMKQK